MAYIYILFAFKFRHQGFNDNLGIYEVSGRYFLPVGSIAHLVSSDGVIRNAWTPEEKREN